MGYTVDWEGADLRCRSERDARRAAEIVNGDPWLSPYHLVVAVWQPPEPGHDWALNVEHFQGDHWHDDQARQVWLAIAPHMADGSTIEFQGEAGERWRIRWEWDACEVCHGQGELAPGNEGAPLERCPRCAGRGGFSRLFEESVQEVVWAVNEEITAEPPVPQRKETS